MSTTSRSKRAKSVSFAEPHHEVIEEPSGSPSIPRAHRDTALAGEETLHQYQALLAWDASAIGSSSSSSSSASTPSPTPAKANRDVDTDADMKDVDVDMESNMDVDAAVSNNSSPEANDHRDDFREKHREHARGEGYALRSLSCSDAEGATACAGYHDRDASSSSSSGAGVSGKKESENGSNTRRLRTVSEPASRSSQGLESVPFEYTGLERVQSMLTGLEESRRRREREKEERERKGE